MAGAGLGAGRAGSGRDAAGGRGDGDGGDAEGAAVEIAVSYRQKRNHGDKPGDLTVMRCFVRSLWHTRCGTDEITFLKIGSQE